MKRLFIAVFLTVLIFLGLMFFSCKSDITVNDILAECPVDIADRALSYAYEYSEADTEYEWGGQDLLRTVKIDCSGLIVNCYVYAIRNTKYSLPFNDAAVINLYREWTVKTDLPRPGDLIFMGDDRDTPSHAAIFAKKKDDCIFFIDSTLKTTDAIDGVSERNYAESDPRFLSFGVLLLRIK
jgi:hypothetical protein